MKKKQALMPKGQEQRLEFHTILPLVWIDQSINLSHVWYFQRGSGVRGLKIRPPLSTTAVPARGSLHLREPFHRASCFYLLFEKDAYSDTLEQTDILAVGPTPSAKIC